MPDPKWPLSLPLVSWNHHDQVQLFDAFCGIQVFGATGSGKSSTTVENFNKAFLLNGFGGFYQSVKPDDPENFLRQAEECGRGDDVIMFGPKHATTLNFIAECLGAGGAGLAANITTVLSIVSELTMNSRPQGGGVENGSFWQKLDDHFCSAAAQLLMMSGEAVTTINLERLLLAIPRSREQIGESDWQDKSYVWQCLRTADEVAMHPEDREQLARLADYFCVDLPQIGEKMRATIQTSVGSTLDIFNQALTKRLISSDSPNFRMDMLQEGKLLIVDMPTMTYGAISRAIQMTLRYCFQLAQNRRDIRSNPRPVAMVCDENQVLADLERDAMFGATSRSTRTVCLYATQSLSAYLAQASGPQAESRVHALLGNCQLQVFHQTTDTKTIEYAQSLFGKSKLLLMQGGTQQQDSDWVSSALGIGQPGSVNAGYAEHLDHYLQAEHFHRLSKGGPHCNWIVDGIIYQGGKNFCATGGPYLPVRYQQRPNAL